MSGRAQADERPLGDGAVGRGRDGSPRVDGASGGVDDGASGARAVVVEEIAGAVDLSIIMVGGAGAAKTTSGAEDGGISQKKGHGVVIAGNSNGRDLVEIAGVGVVDFRDQL